VREGIQHLVAARRTAVHPLTSVVAVAAEVTSCGMRASSPGEESAASAAALLAALLVSLAVAAARPRLRLRLLLGRALDTGVSAATEAVVVRLRGPARGLTRPAPVREAALVLRIAWYTSLRRHRGGHT